MIKFILGIAIVAFSTFCGYLLAGKYRRRKEFFLQFKEFNERFLSEISYTRRPIGEFVALYSYKGEFEQLLHIFFDSISKNRLKEEKITDNPPFCFLTQEEKALTEDYFLMLGKGDSSSQKGYFSSAKEKLAKLQNDSEIACKRYGDLYVKLGFLCGLFILVLII